MRRLPRRKRLGIRGPIAAVIAAVLTGMAAPDALAAHGAPLRWLVLDWAAIGDVDYTASTVLAKAIEHLHQRHIRLVFCSVLGPVRHQLDRYGISNALGQDAYFDTPGHALDAFYSTVRQVGS